MKVGDRVVIKGGAGLGHAYMDCVGREGYIDEVLPEWFDGRGGYVIRFDSFPRELVYLKENIALVKEQQVLEILREYESRRQGNSNRG